MDITNPLVQDALTIYREAVKYVQEQKQSRAYQVLHGHGGSYMDALKSDTVNQATKNWLEDIRAALCQEMY